MDHPFWKTVLRVCDQHTDSISDFIFKAGDDLAMYRDGALERVSEKVPADFLENLAEVTRMPGTDCNLDRDRTLQRGTHRFRINLYRSRGQLKAVARLLPKKVPPLDQLGLPERAIRRMLGMVDQGGLILVTGPTGSGKNTTVASYLNSLVVRTPGHIVTIEDPIEHLIGEGTGFEWRVSQREVGTDVPSFEAGIQSILRQAPKIIFGGEIRSKESARTMLEAAQTGHLVVTTMHTSSAAETVDRFLRYFSPAELTYITATMAEALRMVICQRLIRRIDQPRGRVAAFEILIPTKAMQRHIKDNKVQDIAAAMEIAGSEGNVTFRQSFRLLSQSGTISPEHLQRITD